MSRIRALGSGGRAVIALATVGIGLAVAGCGDAPAARADGAAGPSAAAAASSPAPEAPATQAQAGLQKTFPPQDHLNKIVAAYNVAHDNPELLTGLPCYCPCELYGHGGVVDCHRSQHSAMCNICMDEAIEAGQLYQQQLASGVDDIPAVQAQVKNRYRQALVQQTAQSFPGMNTQQGQSFLQACSDCHQPPSPAMHLPADWDGSLSRMEQYARGSGAYPGDQIWQAAVEYVKSVAAQVPPTTVAQYRRSLEQTVDHLKKAEGDAAYYPSVRDPVLDPAWAERMAAAYQTARALPVEVLNVPTECEECLEAGNVTVLACLNSMQAITCETAIEEVEKLAAAYQAQQQ